jgi:hypothetical protein
MNGTTKLGFLLSHFGQNQAAYEFIHNANLFIDGGCAKGVDIIAFVNNQARPILHPVFASMNINEAFDFNGHVIATNIATAEKMLHFPGPKRRYFYVWDLEWMRPNTQRSFDELSELYTNPRLTLVARHRDHAAVIERCWNCKVSAVIPGFDVEAFAEMAREDAKN